MPAAPDMGTLGAAMGGAPPGASAQSSPDASAQPPPGQVPPPAAGSESPAGAIAIAKARVQVALSMLNSTIAQFQPGSREHHAVMEVTRKLAREFAGQPQSQQLAKSETDMLQNSAANTGAASLNA